VLLCHEKSAFSLPQPDTDNSGWGRHKQKDTHHLLAEPWVRIRSSTPVWFLYLKPNFRFTFVASFLLFYFFSLQVFLGGRYIVLQILFWYLNKTTPLVLAAWHSLKFGLP